MLSNLTVATLGVLIVIAAIRRSGSSNQVTWLLFRWRYRTLLLTLAALAVLLHILRL